MSVTSLASDFLPANLFGVSSGGSLLTGDSITGLVESVFASLNMAAGAGDFASLWSTADTVDYYDGENASLSLDFAEGTRVDR